MSDMARLEVVRRDMGFPRLGVAEPLDEKPERGVVGAPAPVEEEVARLGPRCRDVLRNKGRELVPAYLARTGCFTTLKIT